MRRYYCDICSKQFRPSNTQMSKEGVFSETLRFLHIEDICPSCESIFPSVLKKVNPVESFIRAWREAAINSSVPEIAEDVDCSSGVEAPKQLWSVDELYDLRSKHLSNDVTACKLEDTTTSSTQSESKLHGHAPKLSDDAIKSYADKIYKQEMTGKAAAAELGVTYATLVRSINRLGLPPIGRKMVAKPSSEISNASDEETRSDNTIDSAPIVFGTQVSLKKKTCSAV